jgi:hypothetical protein
MQSGRWPGGAYSHGAPGFCIRRPEADLLLHAITHYWQGEIIFAAWIYGLCALLFVLGCGRADFLQKDSRELFHEYPDLAVAIGLILALVPQLIPRVLVDYTFFMLT